MPKQDFQPFIDDLNALMAKHSVTFGATYDIDCDGMRLWVRKGHGRIALARPGKSGLAFRVKLDDELVLVK